MFVFFLIQKNASAYICRNTTFSKQIIFLLLKSSLFPFIQVGIVVRSLTFIFRLIKTRIGKSLNIDHNKSLSNRHAELPACVYSLGAWSITLLLFTELLRLEEVSWLEVAHWSDRKQTWETLPACWVISIRQPGTTHNRPSPHTFTGDEQTISITGLMLQGWMLSMHTFQNAHEYIHTHTHTHTHQGSRQKWECFIDLQRNPLPLLVLLDIPVPNLPLIIFFSATTGPAAVTDPASRWAFFSVLASS